MRPGDKGYIDKITQKAKLQAAKSLKPDFIYGEFGVGIKKNAS